MVTDKHNFVPENIKLTFPLEPVLLFQVCRTVHHFFHMHASGPFIQIHAASCRMPQSACDPFSLLYCTAQSA